MEITYLEKIKDSGKDIQKTYLVISLCGLHAAAWGKPYICTGSIAYENKEKVNKKINSKVSRKGYRVVQFTEDKFQEELAKVQSACLQLFKYLTANTRLKNGVTWAKDAKAFWLACDNIEKSSYDIEEVIPKKIPGKKSSTPTIKKPVEQTLKEMQIKYDIDTGLISTIIFQMSDSFYVLSDILDRGSTNSDRDYPSALRPAFIKGIWKILTEIITDINPKDKGIKMLMKDIKKSSQPMTHILKLRSMIYILTIPDFRNKLKLYFYELEHKRNPLKKYIRRNKELLEFGNKRLGIKDEDMDDLISFSKIKNISAIQLVRVHLIIKKIDNARKSIFENKKIPAELPI